MVTGNDHWEGASRIVGKADSSGQPLEGCCNLDLQQTTRAIKEKRWGICQSICLIMKSRIHVCHTLDFLHVCFSMSVFFLRRFEANAPLCFISFFEQRVRTHCCVQPLSHEMRFVYDLSTPLANNGRGYCQHSCPYQASREGQRSLAKITGKEGSRITGKENSSGQLRQGCCNLDLEQATGAIKGKRWDIYTFHFII